MQLRNTTNQISNVDIVTDRNWFLSILSFFCVSFHPVCVVCSAFLPHFDFFSYSQHAAEIHSDRGLCPDSNVTHTFPYSIFFSSLFYFENFMQFVLRLIWWWFCLVLAMSCTVSEWSWAKCMQKKKSLPQSWIAHRTDKQNICKACICLNYLPISIDRDRWCFIHFCRVCCQSRWSICIGLMHSVQLIVVDVVVFCLSYFVRSCSRRRLMYTAQNIPILMPQGKWINWPR